MAGRSNRVNKAVVRTLTKMWSKIKEFLRAAKARTSEALDATIAAAFQSVTSQDALSWFASCGYTI